MRVVRPVDPYIIDQRPRCKPTKRIIWIAAIESVRKLGKDLCDILKIGRKTGSKSLDDVQNSGFEFQLRQSIHRLIDERGTWKRRVQRFDRVSDPSDFRSSKMVFE